MGEETQAPPTCSIPRAFHSRAQDQAGRFQNQRRQTTMSNKVRSYTAGYVPGESHVDEENEDLSARKPRATTTLFEARPGGYMQQYGTPLSAAFSPSPFLRRPGDPPIKMGFLAATINLAKVMAGAGMLVRIVLVASGEIAPEFSGKCKG